MAKKEATLLTRIRRVIDAEIDYCATRIAERVPSELRHGRRHFITVYGPSLAACRWLLEEVHRATLSGHTEPPPLLRTKLREWVQERGPTSKENREELWKLLKQCS